MIFETNRLVFKLDFRMSERSKRSRNKGNDARQAALDKIRNARQSGTVADYDIGEVDNIFEEVDEDEYEVNFLQGTNSGRAWVYFMISMDRTTLVLGLIMACPSMSDRYRAIRCKIISVQCVTYS